MTKDSFDPLALHHDSFVADMHCDTVLHLRRGNDIVRLPNYAHIDLARLKQGGVKLQVFASFLSSDTPSNEGFDLIDRTIDVLLEQFQRHSDLISVCRNSKEIEAAVAARKIAAVLAIENGKALNNRLENVEYFYRKGVRSITLTHSKHLDWCASSSDTSAPDFGLKPFGREVVAEMNRLGMLVDVSHVSIRAFADVLSVTKSPVVASHSSVFSICPHDRNLNDRQLRMLAENGGLVGTNFCCYFLSDAFNRRSAAFPEKYPQEYKRLDNLFAKVCTPDEYEHELESLSGFISTWQRATSDVRPSIATVSDHIDYVCKLVGTQHVGLGSDFDGIFPTPTGLEDCSRLPALTEELARRGYAQEDLKKILGHNFLRVFKVVCG